MNSKLKRNGEINKLYILNGLNGLPYRLDPSNKKVTIRKRIINADSIQEFRDILSKVDWRTLCSISNPKNRLNESKSYTQNL